MLKVAEAESMKSAGLGCACRRAFDVVCAGTALIVFGPLLVAVAVALWFESGRPVLYAQTRVGRRGVPFRMYKFRKFYASCDDSGLPLTLTDDDRLTVIGRILRSTKLDELPQLWNVLEGTMSIVGPRPESMAFADCFTGGFEEVLEYKPGIFGPSQVAYRNESVFYSDAGHPADLYRRQLFPAKARIDLAYYPHRTLSKDVLWAVRTVLAVLGLLRTGGSAADACPVFAEVRSHGQRGGGSSDV